MRDSDLSIHRAAPPNHLTPDELRMRPPLDGVTLSVDPGRAGWRYLSFRSLALRAGESVALGAGAATRCGRSGMARSCS